MKTCRYCLIEKNLDQFPLTSKKMPSAKCRICTKIANAEAYRLSKDKVSERSKAYYLKNSSAIKARVGAYRKANPDAITERKAKYYQENKDRLNKRLSEKNAANPDIRAEYRVRNKDTIAAYMTKWQQENAIKRRANESRRRHRTVGKFSSDAVAFLLHAQKGKCVVCRTFLNGVYDIDHITPLSKGGLNVDSNIQLLCPICNRKKHAKDPIAFMQSVGFLL